MYCYTSNLTEYNFEQLEKGVYVDSLDSNIKNYIYTRAYILNTLQADESNMPEYEELAKLESLNETLQKTFENKDIEGIADLVKTGNIEVQNIEVNKADNEEVLRTIDNLDEHTTKMVSQEQDQDLKNEVINTQIATIEPDNHGDYSYP